jgi:spermidine synthase
VSRSAVLLLLFFGSGAAALVYEVVWIRLLSLTLSITVYALTTVLCAFMAGLGLGAAIAARLADRLARPLLAFGAAELGIAACGLLTPLVLYRLGPAYVWLREGLGESGAAFVLARFALAFGVLLVPTTLMGTTFPFLSRALIQSRADVGRGAGALYAANTLGAVAGCVLAGFVLVPGLGLQASSRLAALANVSVAALAFALGRSRAAGVVPLAEQTRLPPLPGTARLGAFAFAVSGLTAMGYEVLWTRALEHFTHNSTYAYSAMLATFLAGIGVGSAVAARRADRWSSPLRVLGVLQIAVGASVIGALLLYMRFDTLVPALGRGIGGLGSWPRVMLVIFTEAGLAMFATTFFFGATFPAVARVVVDSLDRVGSRIGFAYLCNTLGSILGALLVGFASLPALGVRGSFLGLVGVNLALGGALFAASTPRPAGLAGPALAALLALAAFAWIPPEMLADQYRGRYGILRFYREEVTDTIMVTESGSGARTIRYGDGRGTAGTWTAPEDRMYAHIPMLLHEHPTRVLQIGFGVGNTLASVARYPIERAVCVELSPGVVDAAPFFRETNFDVLEQPRVTLVVDDGRNFLLASRERFDVIRLDPPELHTAGVVNLYTREFYEMAREHLRPGGIFSIWVNNVMTPEEDLRMLLRTVASVFPHVSVWHGPNRYSWVINGSLESHHPDLELLEQKLALPGVREDLASIGIRDAFGFLFHFVMADGDVTRFAGDGPLVVDDHTRLDFSVPRSRDAFFGLSNVNTSNWLVALMDPGGDGGDEDVAARIFLEKVASLWRYKRSVLPHLENVDALGLGADEVRARIEAGAPEPRAAPH